MNIHEFLENDEKKSLLRFLTAGSVDDGKSTLIGRLLHDSKLIYDDHLAALRKDSVRHGTCGDDVDYALLVDGLKAEREQGITIDVAYRYFTTPKRKFIVIDAPGHEQYTRNMATGASGADLAVILIDARKGVLPQTRRHSFIASVLGIRHMLVAINKMDLVGYAEEVFERICDDFGDFAARLGVGDVQFVPLSALRGDNVVERSAAMPWYQGMPLLACLESIQIVGDRNLVDLRFPVQYVMRPNPEFRGYAGTVTSGMIRPGDEVLVLPSGRQTRVRAVLNYEGELAEAFPPMPVVVTLADELDISRGDMLVRPGNLPTITRSLEAMLVWLDAKPMQADAPYLLKHTTNVLDASVAALRYRIDVTTLHRQPATALAMNEIGRVQVVLRRAVACDAYARNRGTGAFVLIDPDSCTTVAAGMILERGHDDDAAFAPRAAREEHHAGHGPAVGGRVSVTERAERLGHQALTIWLTGLPPPELSELAYQLERMLFDRGYMPHVVAPDAAPLAPPPAPAAVPPDVETVCALARVSRVCNDCGLIAIVALPLPTPALRQAAAARLGADRLVVTVMDQAADALAGAIAAENVLAVAPAESAAERVSRIIELLRQRRLLY